MTTKQKLKSQIFGRLVKLISYFTNRTSRKLPTQPPNNTEFKHSAQKLSITQPKIIKNTFRPHWLKKTK